MEKQKQKKNAWKCPTEFTIFYVSYVFLGHKWSKRNSQIAHIHKQIVSFSSLRKINTNQTEEWKKKII